MKFCLSVTLITQLQQPNLKSLMSAPSNLVPIKKILKKRGKKQMLPWHSIASVSHLHPLETMQQYRKLSNKKDKLALWGQLGRKMNCLI